jgi:hypothetical protein
MATLVCPRCGSSQLASMPLDACQWSYECVSCHDILTPKSGDCCVFCSYSDTPCEYSGRTVSSMRD